jgi:DNA-binding NtrC family response regulator
LAAGPVIQLADLPDPIRGPRPIPVATDATNQLPTLPEEGHPLLIGDGGDEATRILFVLRKYNNNRRRAAVELGMSRMSLYKKLHKYGMFVRKGATRPGPGLADRDRIGAVS